MNNTKNWFRWSVAAVLLLSSPAVFAQQKLGDNLGTHKASKTLNMDGNDVDNVRVLNSEGVVIGTASAVSNTSVALQVNGSNKAILLPRVTDLLNTTTPSIVSPLEGMIVYDLTTRKFYLRDNNAWVTYATTSLADGKILVGDSNNTPQPVTMSGDATLSNAGVITIGDDKITTVKILNGNVTNEKLATDAVTEAKILDLAVTARKIGAGSGNNKVLTTDNTGANVWVDRSKFASTDLTSGQILLGNASDIATAVAPTGDVTIDNTGVTTIGADKVTTVKIADLNVTTGKIADLGVTEGKLATDAVTTVKIADLNVTTGKIADLGVTEGKLAADAVTTVKIADLNVTTGKIADLGVTEGKLATDAVTTVKIADLNVTTGKIADLGVTEGKLAANAVTTTKILNGAVTAEKVGSGSGNDKVLTTDNTGANVWVDRSKFASTDLTSGQILLGNASNEAIAVAPSGDVTIDNTGVTTIGADKVTTAKILNENVTAAKLATDAVTTVKIADLNVTTGKIADLGVTEGKLAADAVTTVKIADLNVTTGKIADLSVTEGKLAANAVTTVKIADLNVTTGKIADLNVTTDKLAADAVTTAKILDSNVTTGKIADLNVTTDKLAVNAVTTAKITDLNVTTDKLAADAVTTAKITDLAVTAAKVGSGSGNDKVLTTDNTGANVWVDRSKFASTDLNSGQILLGNASNEAIAVAPSGDVTIDNAGVTTIGADKVTTAKILNSNVTTAKIADLNVTTDKLAADAVTTAKILDSNVTTGKIADLNVTTDKLAADAVTTAKILDSNVTTGKIADLNVTTDKLAVNAVTTAKITDLNVTTDKLAASAVTTAKITDLAVTAAKVGSGSGNDKVLTTDNTGANVWVDRSKFASTDLNSGQILLGNATNVATAVAPAGDVTISNAGVTTIGTDKVTTAKILNSNVTTEKIADLNVTTDKLAADAVTTAKILNSNVTTAKIADLNVTTDKLAADAVTTVKILDANVTTGKIADLNVTTDKLAASAVTTAKITDLAVTAVKVGSGSGNDKVLTTDNTGSNVWVDRSKFASTDLNSGQILLGNATNVATAVAPAGDVTISNAGVTTIGADKVTTAKILNSNVTTAKIADLNVTTDKLAADAVTTAKILNSNVTTAKIADLNVTTDKLAADAVTTAKILNSNVTTAKIADLNVTTAKIADLNVTTGKIADLNVTTDKLAASAVTTAKITDLAVTAVKVGSGSGNDKVLTTDNTGANVWVDRSKFASTDLNSGQILLGNATNVATAVAPAGDVTISNTGVTTIGADKVTTAKILNSNVTTDKIADLNVTTDKLAADAVTTAKILNSNVTTAKIADQNVTTAKIADLNVTTAKIADLNVTNGKLEADAITTDKIKDGEVKSADIASDASVDANRAITTTHIRDKAVTLAKINPGTANQVLITNGLGNAAWTTASGIYVDLVSNQTVGGVKTFSANGGMVATGTYATGTIPVTGAGVRTMWYPAKAAFRTGYVTGTQWDDTNIGLMSFAAGYNVKAGGYNAATIGINTDASGQSSFATGESTTASGSYSTAMGRNVSTSGKDGAFIIGDNISGTTNTGVTQNTLAHQMTMRFANGYRFGTTADGTGVLTAGITVAPNGIASYMTDVTASLTDAKMLVNKAYVDASKPALNSAQILVGNATNVATAVSLSGDATISNTGALTIGTDAITTSKIIDNAVTTAKINNASVTVAKLATAGAADADKVYTTDGSGVPSLTARSAFASSTLNSAQILVGNASNVATAAALSGDATISNTGALTIANLAVGTGKLAANAVTSAKLSSSTTVDADRAVGTDHLKDKAVTVAKISNGTANQILATNAGGTAAGWVSGSGMFVDLTTNQTISGVKTFADNGGLVATGSFGSGTIPATGTGSRMMWYPAKAAFRAGYVAGTLWDDGQIGDYSMGIGYNARGYGANSVAIGRTVSAGGLKSFALGSNVSTFAGINVSTATEGSFILGDASFSDDVTFTRSTVNNEMTMRFTGGYRLGTAVNGSGGLTAGVTIAPATGVMSYMTDVTSSLTDNKMLVNKAYVDTKLSSGYVDLTTSQTINGVKTFADNGGLVATGTYGTGTIPATGAGTRMMWYPSKSAFRAGTLASTYATYWDDATTGAYSVSMGRNTYGPGEASISMGDFARSYGNNAVALGKNITAGGNNSVVLGTAASTFSSTSDDATGRSGSFVFADASTTTYTRSSADNQMMMRFAGGYRFYTSADLSSYVDIAAGANGMSITSDVRRKENFEAANGELFLQKIDTLKLSSWNYKKQDPKKFRHYGPMAQDFYHAFGKDSFGTIGNDTTISSADFDGVNMIAIQGLVKRTNDLKKENEALKAEIEALKSQNGRLTESLEQQKESNTATAASVKLMDDRLKQMEMLIRKSNASDAGSGNSTVTASKE